MGTIVNMKEIVASRRAKIGVAVEQLANQGIVPGMTVILVGENPASVSYVKGKEIAAAELGIQLHVARFPETITQAELMTEIAKINADTTVHGLIVQLPLPAHITADAVIVAIDPAKDIDGFHPVHLGEMMLGLPTLVSCTPKGIIAIIKDLGVEIKGKHVVVVGRSNIVGKPVALLALNENATVTICHSHTQNLSEMTKQADILIVAIGRAHFIGAADIKPGAVVIDVGVNRNPNSRKLLGDVDTEAAKEIASFVTPVPGGVGPMTITMLLQNAVEAACMQQGVVFTTIFPE